jgi:hypothetical protein
VEIEEKLVVNSCPVWLVEYAWWVKQHEAKDRESINLREKKMVGSVTQLEAPNVVSPSLVGRSVYRPSSRHGQQGSTFYLGYGLSEKKSVLVREMTVNHNMTMAGSAVQQEALKMVSPSLVGRSVHRPSSHHGQQGSTFYLGYCLSEKKSVLVREMTVNHNMKMAGSAVQQEALKMVSPSLVGRSVHLPSSHHGQQGSTYYLGYGPSEKKSVLVRVMTVNHKMTMVGSVFQQEALKTVSPSLVGRSVYRPSSPFGQHGPTHLSGYGPSGRKGRGNV